MESITIKEEDFILEEAGGIFWDLQLLKTVKPKGGEIRQEFKESGYGLTFETALKKIVNYRITKKLTEESINMKTYIDSYKQEVEKLKNLIK